VSRGFTVNVSSLINDIQKFSKKFFANFFIFLLTTLLLGFILIFMKTKSRKSRGRPSKRNAMKNAICVKLPGSAYTKLKGVSASKRLPVATMVRNQLLDWLEDF
jgi:F0F1-type ATP synthase membrane subunit a